MQIVRIFSTRWMAPTPYTTIQHDGFPYLQLGMNTLPLPWSHGTQLGIMMRSRFMRLTSRGLQWNVHDELLLMTPDQWNKVTCKAISTAMCMEDTADRTVYFSTENIQVPDDWSIFVSEANSFLSRFPNGTSCTSDYTARTLDILDTQYEVSLCDLLDSSLDVIYDPYEELLYWKTNHTSLVEYLLVAVTSIYVISMLSQNMVMILQRGKLPMGEQKQVYMRSNWQVFVAGVIVLYVFVAVLMSYAGAGNGMHIVTRSDTALLVHAFVFCFLDILIPCMYGTRLKIDFANNISLFTICLMLLLMRVYDTADTPYLFIFVFIFGVRSIYKLFDVICDTEKQILCTHVLHLVDAVMYASLLGNGVWKNSDNPGNAVITQATLIISSSFCGFFLYVYKLVHAL